MEVTRHTIQRAQQGDSQAVSEIYQAYVDRIYSYIAYRVNNPQDAEDLTAEVFVKMIEALPSYRFTGAPFEAWLYRIASSRLIDMRRARSRHPQDELPEQLSHDRPPPEKRLLDAQEKDELQAAFAQLSDSDQQLLYLRFVERRSHKDTAQILGKSLSAVKTAQHRALSRLADLLGEDKTRHYLRGDHDKTTPKS